MTLDARARATAQKSLSKFGKVIMISSITQGVYDPSTGVMAGEASVITSHRAIIQDYNGYELVSGVILQGDRKVTIPALDITEPKTGDIVTFDAKDYSVIAVKFVWSGEMAALYKLQVRA